MVDKKKISNVGGLYYKVYPIFCGKRDARAVLVLHKYCRHFRSFVGICSNLILMSRRWYCFPNLKQINILKWNWIWMNLVVAKGKAIY